jgi:vancomycin permeability regulator SanA
VKLPLRIVLVIVAVVALGAVALATAGLVAAPKPADVAIVFGNKVLPTGEPSARLKARLDTARDLFRSGKVRCVIVSGGTGVEGFDESAVMKAYLIASGLPDDAVLADRLGNNTAQTCANARVLMSTHGLNRANVVTQYFHIPRATVACRRAGIHVVGAIAPRFFEARDLYSLAREVIAFPVYLLRSR